MPEYLFGGSESVPPELRTAAEELGNHVFLSAFRTNTFFCSESFAEQLIGGEGGHLASMDFGGKRVTIVSPIAHTSKSLFDKTVRGRLGTGTEEGDVLKLFREHIGTRSGNPAGFLRMVHPSYEADNPFAGQLAGRLYVGGEWVKEAGAIDGGYHKGELGPEISLQDYLSIISS